MGYYVSVSGTVTFKNARKPKEVVAAIQKDRLLIETDAPYLAPHPYRGKLNRSDYTEYTARTLSELFDMSYDDMKALTEDNARRLFCV